MRFPKSIPRCITACGISAMLGWMATEWVAGRPSVEGRWFGEALACGLLAGAIGIALNLVGNFAGATWKSRGARGLAGGVIGGLAGALGGSVGNFLHWTIHGSWLIGWIVMGLGVGAVAGIYERSEARLRIGLIGGGVAGVVGGLLCGWIYGLMSPWSPATGRCVASVAFGLNLGGWIELADVIFRRAWLTVVSGDRPGRQLLLTRKPAVLGRAATTSLPLTGGGAGTIDLQHARVVRRGDGRFLLEDNNSREGTTVNRLRVLDKVVLKDGDLIRIGAHALRFNERGRNPVAPAAEKAPTAATSPVTPAPPAPLTPPTTVRSRPTMIRCPTCKKLASAVKRYCEVCKKAF